MKMVVKVRRIPSFLLFCVTPIVSTVYEKRSLQNDWFFRFYQRCVVFFLYFRYLRAYSIHFVTLLVL